jgi:hypothetical protein
MLLVIPNQEYCRKSEASQLSLPAEDILPIVTQEGLLPYRSWSNGDPDLVHVQPGEDGAVTLDDRRFQVASQEELETLITVDFHHMLVRNDYNPVDHGRNLAAAGHPAWAYQVFSLIPEACLTDPEANAVVAVEMQLCLLAWDSVKAEEGRLDRFFASENLLYRAVSRLPDLHQTYQCHAEFWHRLGNADMAARLLRSVQAVAPDDQVQRQLETYPVERPEVEADEETPEWQETDRRPQILFVLPGRCHYGLDVLYDGCCRVLGVDHVTDFPCKPSLHGYVPEHLAHYPCLFTHESAEALREGVLDRLSNGHYDIILFGDVERTLDRDLLRQVVQAVGDTPLFILDQEDDPQDNREAVLEYLGHPSLRGYFKREYLSCIDLGPQAFSLPFAYPDDRVPADVTQPRAEPLFWAGHRQFGLRRLYLGHLEKELGRSLEGSYTQEEYVQALQSARIGLNIFGFGFDTVRYWELPANGCMLLAERLPIRVPHNFKDGESAVFFDDLVDLSDKLNHYLSHPEEATAIARAGHAHLKRYHTSSARARQMLGWIDTVLEEGNAG